MPKLPSDQKATNFAGSGSSPGGPAGTTNGRPSVGQKNWPPKAQAAANAYASQFELPVLLFAIVPLAVITRKADLFFVVLCWLFVAARYAHAAIHVTFNAMPWRLIAFAASVFVMVILWAVFAFRILSVSPTI